MASADLVQTVGGLCSALFGAGMAKIEEHPLRVEVERV
jgi:hypothetical protein